MFQSGAAPARHMVPITIVLSARQLLASQGGHRSTNSLQDTATRGREDTMAFLTTRSAGMTVLAIYLIVVGLTGLVALAVPLAVTAVLALLAGVLILLGR